MKEPCFTARRVFGRETFLLSQLSIALCFVLFSFPAPGAQVFALSRETFENESFLRFYITRDGDTGTAQSVEYSTQDDTAIAGVHYLSVSGTATFAPGQTTAVVEVALIDNGQVDGKREFRLVLTNASPDLIIGPVRFSGCGEFRTLGVVIDNELRPTQLNTSFAPDCAGYPVSAVMPDGRYLADDVDATMLNSNGWVDASFVAGGGALNGGFHATHVFPDGKILGGTPLLPQSGWRLVRLFPDGAVDRLLADFPERTNPLAVQPDGKLLMARYTASTTVLFRVNSDGSYDPTFAERTFVSGSGVVGVRLDGKILTLVQRCLIRLNANGSLDTNFPSFCGVSGLLFRRNGKIIVESGTVFQVDSDGALDHSFSAGPGIGRVNDWVEQSDGRILIRDWQPRRLNVDGSIDPTFAPFVEYRCAEGGGRGPGLWQMPSGEVVLGWDVSTIDGFPCNGVGRFLDGAPRPDFRAFTPPSCYRSAEAALIHIVRTGDTTNAASVEFSTVDDTARSGLDFLPESGTLYFAPREVSKTIAMPLLAKTHITNRIRFMLALSNPSAGYAVVSPIPVVIWPDLRITTEQLRTTGRVRLNGTISGLRYSLDTSTNFNSYWQPVQLWTLRPSIRAAADSLDFNVGIGSSTTQFYRARGDEIYGPARALLSTP